MNALLFRDLFAYLCGTTSIRAAICFMLFFAQLAGTSCFALGTLRLEFVDAETMQPIPVRMSLFRSNGKPAPIRRGTYAIVGSAIDGSIDLRLPPDTYRFIIDRGPEYRQVQGTVVVTDNGDDLKTVRVPRVLSMLYEGWISGELAAEMPVKDTDLRCRADDVKVIGVVEPNAAQATSDEDANAPEPGQPAEVKPEPKLATLPAMARGHIIRGTGSASDLLFIGEQPNQDFAWNENLPSCSFVEAYKHSGRLVVLNPMSKDLPLWLATERIDGIVVLGEYLRKDSKTLTWPNSFAPNQLEMTGPHRLGLWSVEIYQQMLEAGLRIPPIGTSGTGFQPNPLGYTRTYVYADSNAQTWSPDCDTGPLDEETYKQLGAAWWDGLWQGRSVVTGGPLLRPMLEGRPPGHTFNADSGAPLQLTVTLKLTIQDPVEYLEVIQDGRIVYKARLEEYAQQAGRIPPLEFEQSGWVMVRIMTKYADHYQAALSAPWFVNFDGRPRVSGRAVQFFQGLLRQREEELARLPREQIAVHAPHVRAARAFWAGQAELVNAP